MWRLKLLWYTALLMLADVTEPAHEPICSCPGCDECYSTLYPHPCSRRPEDVYYCPQCTKAAERRE